MPIDWPLTLGVHGHEAHIEFPPGSGPELVEVARFGWGTEIWQAGGGPPDGARFVWVHLAVPTVVEAEDRTIAVTEVSAFFRTGGASKLDAAHI